MLCVIFVFFVIDMKLYETHMNGTKTYKDFTSGLSSLEKQTKGPTDLKDPRHVYKKTEYYRYYIYIHRICIYNKYV